MQLSDTESSKKRNEDTAHTPCGRQSPIGDVGRDSVQPRPTNHELTTRRSGKSPVALVHVHWLHDTGCDCRACTRMQRTSCIIIVNNNK